MSIGLLINLLVIIALQLPIYLYVFWLDRWSALHYTVILNAVSFSVGNMAVTKLGFNYYGVQLLITITQAIATYYFWQTTKLKAAMISLLANGICFVLFEIINYYGISL